MINTHICTIEINGNILTRTKDGDIVNEFTGNWTILRKIYKYATLDAKEKAKYSALNPNLYISSIKYIVKHPGTNQGFEVSSSIICNMLKYIIDDGKVNFGGLDTLDGK